MVKIWFPQNTFFIWFFTERAFVRHFWSKGDLKPCIIMYLGNLHNMSLVPVPFGNFFFQILHKKQLNWEESNWPGHFSSTFLNFYASKIDVKLPSKKKVPWHWSGAVRGRSGGQIAIFVQKMQFSGRKSHFFNKFISYKNVQWPKIQFFSMSKKSFSSNPKLIFFTKFNLIICYLPWTT